ncbi:MAG: PAS domain-containing sensor histidine kinase [Oscillospiraceae bacterium]|nr:PAS domain-containing sensor histidine kinase [Oscillospiraceae bacterium]
MSEKVEKKLTISNITEQELDELLRIKVELADVKEQAERNNHILKAMFRAMPDLVFCKDISRRYIECNKTFEKFINHSKDEILGKTFAEVTGETLEIVKFYADVDDSVINEGKTIMQEDVAMSYNGAERFYEMIKTPLIEKNAEGEDEIFGLMGIMHDVTERHILIRNLQDVQVHLEKALDQANSGSTAKSEFLSRMSHELRTPMNAIMGMSQIAKASNDPDKIKACIDEIYDHSRHLMRLISNLLEISSGINKVTEAMFSIASMIEYIESRASSFMDKKQQTLNISISDAVPKIVIANEKRIAQVIIHLLTNASKFSQDNGFVTLSIDLAEEHTEKFMLKVSVIDNGIGMSTEVMNTIFDMFEQGDGSHTRKHEGVGIGLTLSRYIVEMMGGKLFVESELGKGSVFTFTVPVNCHNE